MQRFKQIAEKAMQEAERVDCDEETFHAGLALIWHEFNERLEIEGVNPRSQEILDQIDV